MPRRSTIRLNKRIVDALAVERGDAVFWDREVSGFGVRVYASGRKIYVVQKRGPAGSPKRVSIGPSTDVTVEEARREAAEIVDRLKRGEEAFPEPPAAEPTVADLAERYMKAHVEVNCRAGTVETFGRVVRLYILPELGHMRLSEVERSPRRGAASQDARQALPGEPGAQRAGEDVSARRGVGHDAAAAQSVPVDSPIQGVPARALPVRGGVPAAGAGAGRGGGRRLGVPRRRCRRSACCC